MAEARRVCASATWSRRGEQQRRLSSVGRRCLAGACFVAHQPHRALTRESGGMEPPKKRKYTGLDNEGNDRVNVKEEPSSVLVDENYGEQHAVVSSEGGGGLPAKRNRRSYSLEFKVAVLDSFYNDTETRLNQRKTAIKYGVNRRQIQKWLAQEETLRGSVGAGYTQSHSLGQVPGQTPTASLPSPPSSKEDATSPLSTYLSYQSKIDYLRRGEVGPLTVLEVKGEASEEEELANYVIDEGVEEDDDDDRPINLSKSCGDKRPEKDSRQVDMRAGVS